MRVLTLQSYSTLTKMKWPAEIVVLNEYLVPYVTIDYLGSWLESIYELFEPRETPVIPEFDTYGLGSMINLLASGSYLFSLSTILTLSFVTTTINKICVYFYKNERARMLGILVTSINPYN